MKDKSAKSENVNLSPFEETVTLEHYGKAYKEYMERTPKWLGIPKDAP